MRLEIEPEEGNEHTYSAFGLQEPCAATQAENWSQRCFLYQSQQASGRATFRSRGWVGEKKSALGRQPEKSSCQNVYRAPSIHHPNQTHPELYKNHRGSRSGGLPQSSPLESAVPIRAVPLVSMELVTDAAKELVVPLRVVLLVTMDLVADTMLEPCGRSESPFRISVISWPTPTTPVTLPFPSPRCLSESCRLSLWSTLPFPSPRCFSQSCRLSPWSSLPTPLRSLWYRSGSYCSSPSGPGRSTSTVKPSHH